MKIKQVTVSRKLQAEFQSGELEERLEADEFLIRRERTFISAGPNWPSTRAGRHALFFLRRLLPGGRSGCSAFTPRLAAFRTTIFQAALN
jgi:hypothetical protein